MDEITGPVLAITLVLCAVFVPCCFLGGITGQFFRQFAVTIAVSTIISAINALTLTPALAAILLQAARDAAQRDPADLRLLDADSLGLVLPACFNAGRSTRRHVGSVRSRLGRAACCRAQPARRCSVYGGAARSLDLLGEFDHVPRPGFIPQQDKGYLLLNVQLPDSASVERTQQVMAQIEKIARDTPGVAHTVGVSGQSLILNANAPNLGSMYVMLEEFDERHGPELTRRRHRRASCRSAASSEVRGGRRDGVRRRRRSRAWARPAASS